jgi:hypothetical protein
MTAALFLGYLCVMAAAVVALASRYLGLGTGVVVLAGLSVWLVYVGLLGYFGVVRNTAMRPPGITFILVPVVFFFIFFIIYIVRSNGEGVAMAFPLRVILGTQVFRVGVELFLHQLWIAGLIPKMLTFAGANVDIYIGATAPLIAWVSTRGREGLKLAFAWNLLGLMALANVVSRAVLTSPGPLHLIHAEVPNKMFGTFPYMFIPGFFVPLALLLHVLAIRAIRSRLRTRA